METETIGAPHDHADVVWTICPLGQGGVAGPPRAISRDEAEARAVVAAMATPRDYDVRRIELRPVPAR